jgi:nicotinamidase-related amidase
MADGTYTAHRTALLVVDPYNDFMTEGGKLFNAIKETADASGTFGNLRKILPKVRSANIQVFILPHHRSHPHDFDNWQHINMFQKAGLPTKAFEVGTWGGEFSIPPVLRRARCPGPVFHPAQPPSQCRRRQRYPAVRVQ